MKNILTIDLEDWYHGNFLEDEQRYLVNPETRLVEQTMKVLSLLDKTDNKSTFFVLGECAENFPDLILDIYKRGHEIASHGYEHKLIYKQSNDYFANDLEKSVKLLQSIIGEKVLGFRAPYWSVYKENKWVWDVLRDNGIIYDSSLFPFRTYLYGDNSFPRFRYSVDVSPSSTVEEIPPSVSEIRGARIPFSGGFYFRVLPYPCINYFVNRTNRKESRPAVIYLHPYELDVKKPKSSKGFLNNFILDYNIRNNEKKFLKLLTDFRFISIKSYFGFTA